MPSVNDLYPSKWLTAADLSGSEAVTIERVVIESMKGQDGKPDEFKAVVFFHEKKKGLVCNKTNAGTISAFYGDDTDDWVGEKITIFPTKVQWGSKMVDAIRVDTKLPRRDRPVKPTRVTQAEADAVTAKQPTQRQPGDDDDTDDYGF